MGQFWGYPGLHP